jgi:DNA topoisomerase I
MKLVIVESPAKGKTIEGYLGKGYTVLASYGHVRDLPKSKLGIDLETFEPEYVIPTKARKNVNILKKLAVDAEKVILATDEDREGEAISWHLKQALSATNAKGQIPNTKFERITFHEITKDAILSAIQNPRELDINLVNAQQGRRVLDRLVGYNLSPLLWKKIRKGLSAGRVQSVAVKLIVDREREIQAFKPDEYWEFEADLAKKATKANFAAKLTKLKGKNLLIENQKTADKIEADLQASDYIVDKVEKKEYKKTPPAPFTTSTLQQESARKLRFSAKKTMVLAQKLYEGVKIPGEGTHGLITYMRTDSTNLSAQAVSEARSYIEKNLGKEYLSAGARSYKKSKGAQEAHEAVRPTSFLRDLGVLKEILEPDSFKLYELIFKRALASQMAEEVLDLTGIDVKAGDYTLRANGKQVKFAGFAKIYVSGTEEKIAEDSKEVILPDLAVGDNLDLLKLDKLQKFTQPPARYSEASLIKTLEKNGIGRPSTYAPTLSTIKDRGYVILENRYFKPEEIGFIVNDLLVKNFPEVVNLDFTAEMEADLDKVAEGKEEWKTPIKKFWGPFVKEMEKAEESIEKINTDVETDEVCEKCGKPMVIKTGRFGKFMACTGFPDCKNTKNIVEKAAGKCPTCKEGDIVVKRTKRGRTFYGCSRYPDCDYATWKLPAEEKETSD